MNATLQGPHRKPESQGMGKGRLKRRRFKRGFQELPLYLTAFQDGKARFPSTKGGLNYRPPRINAWRNNLTACSQRHNLYFVACLDWIHVYKPQHPHHALPDKPCLKWQLPVTSEFLRGDITQVSSHDKSSHSVNNMLVADLGNKEVILFACDDGDVLGYHTDSLLFASAASDSREETLAAWLPKPFLHQSVGRSAWGLAVHTNARLIAVSANTHNIKVLALGLDRHSTESDFRDIGLNIKAKNEPTASPKGSLLRARHSNHVRVLRGHATNIPSISFCNAPEDPDGRYLASTDISGVTIIWNVDTGKSVRLLAPLRHGSDENQRFFDDYDTSRDGWGVIFLDARCFARTKNIVQATGTCVRVKHDLNAVEPKRSSCMYDVSESQSMVSNTAEWTAKGRPTEQDDIEDYSTPDLFGSGISSDRSDDEDEETDSSAAILESCDSLAHERPAAIADQTNFQKNKHGIIPEDRIGPGISQSDLMGHKWSIFSCYTLPNPPDPDPKLPQTPMLLLNPRKVLLFQSPNLNLRHDSPDAADPYPVIHLDEPLAQKVPTSIAESLNYLDRLNLYLQIPELGVVLVGSPKGRVAVLTLHRLEPAIDPYTGQLETDVKSPLYTMRLDHLLPFADEEERGMRPLKPLVGIAASPVFGVDKRRPRYRIFLSYLNHTVLIYEIGRQSGACGGFADVFAF